ncbi:hypothetical protein E1298_42155, partial [Actinomadura rubrisoli]
MATCPNGHTSRADDYCDVCGERIGGAPPSPSSPSGGSGPGASGNHVPPPRPGGASGGGSACPDCGTPASDRFCEACGYDFATGGGKPTP